MCSVDNDKLLKLLERLEIHEGQVCEDEVLSTVNSVSEECRVPSLTDPHVPHTTQNFEGVADNAEIHLSVILKILDSIRKAKERGQKFSPLFTRQIVVQCFLASCEYVCSDWDWSNERTADKCENIMKDLCKLCDCKSVSTLLNGESSHANPSEMFHTPESEITYVQPVLQKLSEMLNKSNWKTYPALKMSYWWILQHIDVSSFFIQ